MKGAIFIIAGRAGIGKTAFVERLIPGLKSAGLKVVTVKTSHTQFKPSYPASDPHRHLLAGAERAILAQSEGEVVFSGTQGVEKILERESQDCDVLLYEGHPDGIHPVIEVVRVGAAHYSDEQVWLTVTDRTVGRELEVETPEKAAEQILLKLGISAAKS